MPTRKVSLVTNKIYHVFNRSVANEEIFSRDTHSPYRFLELIDYYRFIKNPLRYSYFKKLTKKVQTEYLKSLYDSQERVKIVSFCIMPNHYHLLIKQTIEDGIKEFIRQIQIGYAMYYNIKYDRQGSLYQNPFRAVQIESEEQLIHTSRYIHLNPVSSNLIKDNKLDDYHLTSFTDYLSNEPRKFVTTEILDYFENKEELSSFTKDRVSYQQNLQKIKSELNHRPGL